LEFVDAYSEPLVYELPVHARTEKTGRGQVQYWFLFRFRGSNDALDLKKGGEFRSWRWTSFDDTLIDSTAKFRKPVYRQLPERFRDYRKPTPDPSR
jgi:putative (di)nucleoside polyphosphate hydrolase